MMKKEPTKRKVQRDWKELLKVANTHHDNDERFMAGMDLCNKMLESYHVHESVDTQVETQVCDAFIKHLEDSNSDVQTNAVKSIENVISYLKESNVKLICEKLTE